MTYKQFVNNVRIINPFVKNLIMLSICLAFLFGAGAGYWVNVPHTTKETSAEKCFKAHSMGYMNSVKKYCGDTK